MPLVFGKDRSPSMLKRYMTDVNHIAGVRRSVLQEGRAEGVQVVDFKTGSGFEFTAAPGRALDIISASYKGIPLSWYASPGAVAASFFEPQGMGWLRGYIGGLLTTGGLTSMGQPSTDNGEELGIHGRVSYSPASNVWADAAWDGDTYRLWVRGKVTESVALGPNIAMQREISTTLGASRFVIRDTVENLTFRRVEHMMLYHFNVGFPVLSETSQLLLNSMETIPRDDDSRAALAHWDRFECPEIDRPHQLFYHKLKSDGEGKVYVLLVGMQDVVPLAVYLAYDQDMLPWFANWKCMQAGDYVTGIEPCNAWVEGRAAERQAGRLRFLEPWQKVSYEVEFGVLEGQAEIETFAAQHELPAPQWLEQS